jgi:hypothetical protein
VISNLPSGTSPRHRYFFLPDAEPPKPCADCGSELHTTEDCTAHEVWGDFAGDNDE